MLKCDLLRDICYVLLMIVLLFLFHVLSFLFPFPVMRAGTPLGSLWHPSQRLQLFAYINCHRLLNPVSCVCARAHVWFPHTKSSSQTPAVVLQFNSLLTLSAQREHQLSQVKDSVLQDGTHPPFEASGKSRLSPVLLAVWL